MDIGSVQARIENQTRSRFEIIIKKIVILSRIKLLFLKFAKFLNVDLFIF